MGLPAAGRKPAGSFALKHRPRRADPGGRRGIQVSLLVFPEPVTALLVGIGVLGLWALGRIPQ